MDLIEYRGRLQALRDNIDREIEAIMVPRANELLANIKNRIMRRGKNSNGQPIGNYSTKPMYAGRDDFDKTSAFKARGKKPRTVDTYRVSSRRKQRVEVRHDYGTYKTMYLSGGYKELRDIQGKPTEFVNLMYRGDLLQNGYQLMYNTSDKVIYLGFVSEKFGLIRKGLEQKYGAPIMRATVEEINEHKKQVAHDFSQIIIRGLK